MSYIIDSDGDIVISGFNQGIGVSPYSGLSDLKSVDIGGVAGEASVNFSTSKVSQTTITNATIVSTNSSNNFIGVSSATVLNLVNGSVIVFSASNSWGVSNSTNYYVGNLTGTLFKLYTDYARASVVTVTSNSGTGTFSSLDPGLPKFFATMADGAAGTNFMLDANGRLWSDNLTTPNWTYTGNTIFSTTVQAESHGNGLLYWRTANSTAIGDWDGWLFVFRNGFVDYSNVNGVNNGVAYNNVGTYTYGWNIVGGGTSASPIFTGAYIVGSCPHNGVVGPDNNMYFVDAYTSWKIQQTDIVSPVTFSPASTATYIATHAHNLPINETATCIAPLGTDFIIGGIHNVAYIWNGVDQLTITQPILLAESYTAQIVTVNTNAFLLTGNKGNIYVTNGAQATPWAKIPDHIANIGTSSGTGANLIEPYFSWGGATYNKGRLYFGAYAVQNDGTTAVSGYGGLWAVDLNTKAMWLSNQLSYGTYTGYASALLALPPRYSTTIPLTQPAGSALFIGWVDGTGTGYGIDSTVSSPYTSGQSYVISDAIPIGTFLKPMTPGQFEYKLALPLVTGETVELQASDSLNGRFTTIGTTTGVTGQNQLSETFSSTIQEQQWLYIKAILNSVSSNGSFNRITQLRVIGGTLQTGNQTIPFSLQ